MTITITVTAYILGILTGVILATITITESVRYAAIILSHSIDHLARAISPAIQAAPIITERKKNA